MRINESRIRRIIREETHRIISEGDDNDLRIHDFEWDDIHNDGGTRSQGGELTLTFSVGGTTDMKAKRYISSYIMSEMSLLEDLTDEINSTLEQNDLPGVSMEDVKSALAPKLDGIMDALQRSEDIYQRDADAAEGGGGDFFESRRRLREGSSPSTAFNRIKGICEEVLMNKSLGTKPAVAERAAERIRDALKDI